MLISLSTENDETIHWISDTLNHHDTNIRPSDLADTDSLFVVQMAACWTADTARLRFGAVCSAEAALASRFVPNPRTGPLPGETKVGQTASQRPSRLQVRTVARFAQLRLSSIPESICKRGDSSGQHLGQSPRTRVANTYWHEEKACA